MKHEESPAAPPHEDIPEIVRKHSQDGDGLISILEDIQSQHGYLPEDALRTVSRVSGRSLVDIYGVATFYRSFSLRPRGKHVIYACLGTACHVRSGPKVVEQFERQLGIKAGETTADGEVTLETVNCLGACALGPIVVADGEYFSKVDTGKVAQILQKLQGGSGKSPERQAQLSTAGQGRMAACQS